MEHQETNPGYAQPMESKPRPVAKIKQLMAEYGPVALGVYLVLFGLVLGGFYTAILLGFQPERASSTGGALFAAWVATKLTQPARLGVTAVLTPIVARFLTVRDDTELKSPPS